MRPTAGEPERGGAGVSVGAVLDAEEAVYLGLVEADYGLALDEEHGDAADLAALQLALGPRVPGGVHLAEADAVVAQVLLDPGAPGAALASEEDDPGLMGTFHACSPAASLRG